MTTIDGIRRYNSYHLATLAEAYAPDDPNGDGAALLDKVTRETIYAVQLRAKEYGLTFAEVVEEHRESIQDSVADNAPNPDPDLMWREFVDLAAYRELDRLRKEGTPNDDTPAGWAELALFTIAFRLVSALLTEIQEG
ncbi:hypothetical protein [Streptomyces werraensis]|uniref:hypothetical protein n=1 Tax=Streptomyces werraensis TaxID=68284 RepID=UPI002920D62B|nr:OCR-like antirestriction protein [Streptomyces phage Marav]